VEFAKEMGNLAAIVTITTLAQRILVTSTTEPAFLLLSVALNQLINARTPIVSQLELTLEIV